MKINTKRVSRVCVLLATYNGSNYLQEQLDSIHSQENCECTIIARDDGSSDETLSLLKANQVHIIELPVEQLGASLNFLTLIKFFAEHYGEDDFDFVALADQDDIWLPDKLSRATAVLDSGYDCYSSGFYEYSEKAGAWIRGRTVNKSFSIKPLSYLGRSPGPGFTYVFKSRVIVKLVDDKLFQRVFSDEDIVPHWHDWALFAFATKLNFSWVIDEWAATLYRLHHSNHTGLLSYRNFLSRLKFFFSGDYYHEMKKISYFRGDKDVHNRLIRMSIKDRFFFIFRVNQLRSNPIEKIFLIFLFLTAR